METKEGENIMPPKDYYKQRAKKKPSRTTTGTSRPGSKDTSQSAKDFAKKYEATRGGPTVEELEGLIRRDITPTKYDKPTGWHPGVGRDKKGYLPGHPLYSGGVDEVVTEEKKVVTDDDEKEKVKYYDDELGGISERDLKSWELKLGQEAIIRNGKVFFRDKTTNKLVPYGKMIRALGGALDQWTGFNPTKAFGEMGATGKAALYNKISKMSQPEFEKFLNRKGNLDRLLSYYKGSGVSRGNIDEILKTGDVQGFANLIKGGGGEGFDKALDKIQDPQKYWNENPPRTSAEAEEAAMAGISWIEGYGTVERPEGQGGGIGGLGGGGGGALPPVTDPTTTTVPDYILRQQYMPGFTPDYTGGPEQMQIAGGYWDPVTQKWIGQGPWGTQGQYQAPPTTMAQGGIVGTSPLLFKNQGGMVNDNGIKAFKKYGY